MRILQTQPLFAWECLDDSPNLKTIKEFLATIPDAKLLASLRAWRGRGRDDYPVHALWGTLVLTIALRHPSIEGCLAELRRNEGLRRLIGIESESQVPKAWNMSRFLEVLGREPHRSLLKGVFNEMARRLGQVVPDLGRQTAGDSAALSARCVPEEKRGVMQDGLPVPSGGRKEYTDESGTVYCYDKVSGPAVRHRMSYIGHEPKRQTIKYRCPARHEGWACPSEKRCNAGKDYGKTVRVKREVDLRRFPPIPRATKQFERLYKGRTAVERVNARIKVFWGADDGNIVGALRFHAFLGTVMVVHLGFATLLASPPRVEGTLGRMRLGPIAEALRKRWAG